MRVLVTGGTGTLGSALLPAFDDIDLLAPSRAQLDLRDRRHVHDVVTALRPDVVVHCAALTNVDRCEQQPDDAFALNALATRELATASSRVGARIHYISTDYVFDGDRADPYTEWDDPSPLQVYGRSKLAGEWEAGPAATIIRTSWICGRGPVNFVANVLRLSDEHHVLRFVADQRSRPTMASDLAAVVRRLVTEQRQGVFHVTNEGTASRFEMVQVILEAAGRDPQQVEPVPAHDVDPPQLARRPRQSVLDNAVLRMEGAPPLRDWRDALAGLVRSMVD